MDRLQVGDPGQIGPFRLLGRLGDGGMGRVYLGQSPGGRKVAIKVVHPHHASNPDFRRRFAREVATARQVGGFHTAAVVGADPDADPPWMATAYIPGPSLAQAVDQDGPLDEEGVRQLGAALAEGLAAIHDCGLIHRDLKPGNVIMADDGPRIIDFGIAKGAEATALTESSAVIGTLRYMSPEQLNGLELTPQSDIFALGTVLAFAATGHDPFRAPTIPAVITRILTGPPDLESLSGDLRGVIADCLAKDPGTRPGPGDVLARLSGLQAHDPTMAGGPAPVPAAAPVPEAGPVLEAVPSPESGRTEAGEPAHAATREPSAESTVSVRPGVAPPPRPVTHRRPAPTSWVGRHRLPVIASACAVIVAAAVALPFVLSSPASSSPSSTPPPSSPSSSSSSAPASSSASASGAFPAGLSVSSFTADIASTMSRFKPLTAAATQGAASLQVGVILPDTTSSTRWVEFDAPYLKEAFTDAGYTAAQFRIDNAQGNDATQLNDATTDINLGAKVLIVCPLDEPTGAAIAELAQQKGITLIAYDRAIFQASHTYYVSFGTEKVGELIGQGFEACVKSWGIKNPKVYILNGGEDVDPNALSFADGYNKVVWGQAAKTVAAGATNSLGYSLVAENFAPGWDNTKGGTIFQQAWVANPSINATIEANDGLANAVITALKAAGVKPGTIPTTGQDASVQGMAWTLQGYQCGSVYKAVYLEAQDAVSLATILLAGKTPPAALLNGTTVDPADSSITEPSSLLTPMWVTKSNMESTVVKDGFDTASAICALAGYSLCSADGIG